MHACFYHKKEHFLSSIIWAKYMKFTVGTSSTFYQDFFYSVFDITFDFFVHWASSYKELSLESEEKSEKIFIHEHF